MCYRVRYPTSVYEKIIQVEAAVEVAGVIVPVVGNVELVPVATHPVAGVLLPTLQCARGATLDHDLVQDRITEPTSMHILLKIPCHSVEKNILPP